MARNLRQPHSPYQMTANRHQLPLHRSLHHIHHAQIKVHRVEVGESVKNHHVEQV